MKFLAFGTLFLLGVSAAFAADQEVDHPRDSNLTTKAGDGSGSVSFSVIFRGPTKVNSFNLNINKLVIYFYDEGEVSVSAGFSGEFRGCIEELGNLLCSVIVDGQLKIELDRSDLEAVSCARVTPNNGGYSCSLRSRQNTRDFQGALVFTPMAEIQSVNSQPNSVTLFAR